MNKKQIQSFIDSIDFSSLQSDSDVYDEAEVAELVGKYTNHKLVYSNDAVHYDLYVLANIVEVVNPTTESEFLRARSACEVIYDGHCIFSPNELNKAIVVDMMYLRYKGVSNTHMSDQRFRRLCVECLSAPTTRIGKIMNWFLKN